MRTVSPFLAALLAVCVARMLGPGHPGHPGHAYWHDPFAVLAGTALSWCVFRIGERVRNRGRTSRGR